MYSQYVFIGVPLQPTGAFSAHVMALTHKPSFGRSVSQKWLEAKRLALNIEKTNFVLFHFSRHKLTQTIVLKIGKNKIKQETHVRFPGVLLDSTLSWNLTELSKKLARTVGLFYKIRHYDPHDTLLLLYHAIFAPILAYGVSVWGLTYTSLLNPISVLQRKILGS